MTRDELAAALGLSGMIDRYLPEHSLDLQGWNSDSLAFETIFKQIDPRIMVDVGVWKGGSTAALARRARASGTDGYVVAVDTFLGSPEHWLPTAHGDFRRDLLIRDGMPGLFWQFMSNIRLLGLEGHIVPFAQTSAHAARILGSLGFSADLVHIDAGHDDRSVCQDLEDWWRLLRPGGAMIVDDYLAEWPGVMAVVDDFARDHAETVTILPPKAVLFRPMGEEPVRSRTDPAL